MDATPKTPPAVIYIATSGHGHKSHTTRMEHPAQNAGVDQVLKCAQHNLTAFKMAVDTEDVAALRSMLRKMNPQYDAACKQYGIPKAPSAKSRQQKAAAALEAKACEVAAGMDVRVDENGQLVTTVKAASDEETKMFASWLPPVAFNDCNGDIFYDPGREKKVSDFFSSFSSVDKKFEPHVRELFGVKGAGTSSTDNYKQCKQTDMVGAAGGSTGYISEYPGYISEEYISPMEDNCTKSGICPQHGGLSLS